MKKIFLFLIGLVLATPSFGVQIVAVANNEIITDYDIKARIGLMKVLAPEQLKGKNNFERKKKALTSLINEAAKKSLIQKNRATAPQNEVQNSLKRLLNNRKKLPGFNFPMDYCKDYVKTQMAWMKVIQMRITPNASLEEGEVENYYKHLKDTPLIPSTLQLSQIIVEDPERIQGVYNEVKKISSCKKFNEQATLYGAPGSGDMGRIPSKNLALPLQHLFAGAPLGKALEPAPIGSGAIIFMVCDRQQKNLLKDKDMKKRLEVSLLNQKIDVLAEQYLQDYRDQMYIEIKDPTYESVKDDLF